MLGNAWEWCQDDYTAERNESDEKQILVLSNDKLRLWRGGSFIYRAPFQRSAARHRYRPDDWGSTVGLRPARRAGKQSQAKVTYRSAGSRRPNHPLTI